MSIPLWKQTILERKEKKKEEEKRKAAETERRRLDSLPPWKRVIEERNVIIVSADKSTTEVNINKSNTNLHDEKHQESNKVYVSTTTTASGNDKSLERETNIDGVSEEHCSSVGDNPFLKLDRNRPHHTTGPKRDRKQNSRNGDVGFQSQSKTEPTRLDDDVPVQLNINSTTGKENKSLNQVQQSPNNNTARPTSTTTSSSSSSSDNLREYKFPDEKESVDVNDLADKKQLSVSELLGRFKSSSQENLLDVGLQRESRSLQSNQGTTRSKSLDRNTATKLDNSLKSTGKSSIPSSFYNSKQVNNNLKTENLMPTPKVNEITQHELHRPYSISTGSLTKVTIVSNSDYDMQLRKKKNKPDLSASELIDLGEDAPLSPLSTLSPFNFEIIESAHIQQKLKAGVQAEDSFDILAGNNVKTNAAMYNSIVTVPANKYKKHSAVSKTSAINSNKFNDRSKKMNNNVVEANSLKSSGSNNVKVPSTAMLAKNGSIQEDSPVPPPRNKKKKKVPTATLR